MLDQPRRERQQDQLAGRRTRREQAHDQAAAPFEPAVRDHGAEYQGG